ncbi:hypothetical protein ACHAXA_000533 [Cyclostephanos tholiformis]|uniref:Uncharacterized protein n=1 Tax=Cyclostephanos tholiformis TaxID=382380 RepID=A0ABD3SSR3_9STRA
MKYSALLIAASMATASAFAPSTRSAASSTQLNESLFKKISNLDLWAPVADSNDYGARNKKKIAIGKLTEKSYVPTGLTKAQYEKIRADADKKKAINYQKNVAKAGVFTDYTDFYLKRGTDVNGSWMKLPNLGHRMAKTKYDWSGETEGAIPTWTGVKAGDPKAGPKAGAKKVAAPKKKIF